MPEPRITPTTPPAEPAGRSGPPKGSPTDDRHATETAHHDEADHAGEADEQTTE